MQVDQFDTVQEICGISGSIGQNNEAAICEMSSLADGAVSSDRVPIRLATLMWRIEIS